MKKFLLFIAFLSLWLASSVYAIELPEDISEEQGMHVSESGSVLISKYSDSSVYFLESSGYLINEISDAERTDWIEIPFVQEEYSDQYLRLGEPIQLQNRFVFSVTVSAADTPEAVSYYLLSVTPKGEYIQHEKIGNGNTSDSSIILDVVNERRILVSYKHTDQKSRIKQYDRSLQKVGVGYSVNILDELPVVTTYKNDVFFSWVSPKGKLQYSWMKAKKQRLLRNVKKNISASAEKVHDVVVFNKKDVHVIYSANIRDVSSVHMKKKKRISDEVILHSTGRDFYDNRVYIEGNNYGRGQLFVSYTKDRRLATDRTKFNFWNADGWGDQTVIYGEIEGVFRGSRGKWNIDFSNNTLYTYRSGVGWNEETYFGQALPSIKAPRKKGLYIRAKYNEHRITYQTWNPFTDSVISEFVAEEDSNDIYDGVTTSFQRIGNLVLTRSSRYVSQTYSGLLLHVGTTKQYLSESGPDQIYKSYNSLD